MQTGVPPAKQEPRYTELDALRGLAALTVVFHHFRLMWMSAGHEHRWSVIFNPLTSGHEAVMLFFLLSGFVLSIPALRGRGQAYPVYLLRRILRIYAPYLFALLLAIAGAAVWHGALGCGDWAALTWAQPVEPRLVFAHVLMIGNYNWAAYNTAFWSLVVEMRVSIVFPLLFVVVQRLRTRLALLLALVISAGAGFGMVRWPQTEDTVHTVQYAAIFICGIVLARNVERVNAWARGLGKIGWAVVCFSSVVLYTWGHHIAVLLRGTFVGLDQWLITTGAAGYMVLALNAPAVRRFLGTAGARFLGRISYSLYLVHATVLFALTFVLRWRVPMLVQFAIYVPASLLVAYLFCIAVEEPFLRLSRRVGKLARGRAAFAGVPSALGNDGSDGVTPRG